MMMTVSYFPELIISLMMLLFTGTLQGFTNTAEAFTSNIGFGGKQPRLLLSQYPTTTTPTTPTTISVVVSKRPTNKKKTIFPLFLAYFDEGSPSDYDTEDLVGKKQVEVDTDEDDEAIRDELKRELLLLSSVTNRGECAKRDEQNLLIDLVNQLEALNPTVDPASNCEGEWSLCLSSTQLFRSSPFFQSLRVAVGSNNKQLADNGFELHDRATTGSRVGRVRQTITQQQLISEVELEVGVPFLPFRLKGTVVTTAKLTVSSSDTWDLEIQQTSVTGSNVPLFNQFLDDMKPEVPVGDVYKTLQGDIPIVKMKTFYVDEGIRITRDVDENFFVFSRA